MIVNFAAVDLLDRPTIILKNAGGTTIGVLGPVRNVDGYVLFNETSTIEFEYPFYVDGAPTAHYESLVGMRVVELQDVGQFILVNPTETGDGIQKIKKCKGYSLEYEFVLKKITLTNGTYNLWNPLAPDDTVIGIILESMPSWSIGHIDDSLVSKYRTFEVNNINLYNFIKDTVQQTYGCVFDFDTHNRKINIIDVATSVPTQPIYLSHDNLIKELEIKEETENLVTRLDVNGADGVTIRDVNPTGTNKIINLDYFATLDNFSQELIDKYISWKQIYEDSQRPYYNLVVEHSLETMRLVTEQAALSELNHDLQKLENSQAVIIVSINRGLLEQSSLDDINIEISAKKSEIAIQEELIVVIEGNVASLLQQMREINQVCNFDLYFTDEEYKQLDRYIKDDEISDSSFAATSVNSYSTADIGNRLSNVDLIITDSGIVKLTSQAGKDIYDIVGGTIAVGNFLDATIITGAFEVSTDNTFVSTAYLASGTIENDDFIKACISLTGTVTSVTSDVVQNPDMPTLFEGTNLAASIDNAFIYFTQNTSEYERRSISWELYEYGSEILDKLSKPTYTFTIDSANFLSLADFVTFKQNLTLGNRLYIERAEDDVITPILIGAKFSYGDIKRLELEFGSSYSSGDSAFDIVDILEKSVSMGKNVDISRYSYAAFVDSGASSTVAEFMNSALDVSRNAIISSTDQAISWDATGIRLRKWADGAQSTYEPEQVWMNNNSILMTDDNWSTASIAIGKFYDTNVGDCWGIVASRIVGTILAGSNLIIESAKKDGGSAVFRVDGEGCFLYNSNFNIVGNNRHIAMNPQVGIALGSYPVFTEEDGVYTVDEENAKFWVDTEGNLHFKGTLHASDGEFTGSVTATRLVILEGGNEWAIDDYISQTGGFDDIRDAIEDVHNGTTGIYYTGGSALHTCEITTAKGLVLTGRDGDFFRVTNSGMGFFDSDSNPLLFFSNGHLTVNGTVNAYAGTIGGWTINQNEIVAGDLLAGTQMGLRVGDSNWGIWAGSGKFFVRPDGYLHAEDAVVTGSITATGGLIGGFTIGTADTTGLIPNALYCGGQVNASPTATGMSATNAQWAFWAGNGVFRVTQAGNLHATNATLSGTFTSGNWVLDASGYRYTNGSYTVRMAVVAATAYYQTYGYNAFYGSSSYNLTTIQGQNIMMQCDSTGHSISVRDGKYGYDYEDVCLICDNANNSDGTWSNSAGNCGITERRWDVGWFRVMHYDTRPTTSSRALKHDIKELGDFGDIIDHLNPVSFVYNNDIDDKVRYGLIYEDTINVLPEICRCNHEGNNELLGIEYDDLIAILIKEVKSLRQRLVSLESKGEN